MMGKTGNNSFKDLFYTIGPYGLEAPVNCVDEIMLRYERSRWGKRILFWQTLSAVLVIGIFTFVVVSWVSFDDVDFLAQPNEPVKVLLRPEFSQAEVSEILVELPQGVSFVSDSAAVRNLKSVVLDVSKVEDFGEIPIVVEGHGSGSRIITVSAFNSENEIILRDKIKVKFGGF